MRVRPRPSLAFQSLQEVLPSPSLATFSLTSPPLDELCASVLQGLLQGSRIIKRRDLSGPGLCLMVWTKPVKGIGVRTTPPALPLRLVSTFSSESANNTTEMNGEPLHITSFKSFNKLLFFSLLIIALWNHNLPTRNCISLK